MWTVNPDIFESDDVAKSCPEYANMAKQRVGSVSHLLGLISSIVTCMQVNLAMLTVLHCDFERQINFIISPYILKVFFLSGKAPAKQTGQINPGN